VVLVWLEPTQESLEPCRSATTISRISVRFCARYPALTPQLLHATQQHRLGSKGAVLFRPIEGTKQGGFPLASDQPRSCVGLGWSDWQVYRLRGFSWIRSPRQRPVRGVGDDERAGILVSLRRPIEASWPGLVGTHPSPISREPSFHRPSLRAAVWPGSTRTPPRLSLA
jgi:hypothetical protein